MKTKFTIVLLFCVSAFEVLSQESPANCPLGLVVEADGKAEEWPMEWIQDDDKTMSYNICSDDINLYVRMKTSDENVRRKIGVFGLTLWMDPNGKKKKKLGLKFPTGAEGMERTTAMREGQDFSKMSTSERAEVQKQMNKALVADLEMMELIGLADDPLTSTRSGITNGIKVAIVSAEDGSYVYEAIIPFKAFRLSKASIAVLGIGIETGRYTPPPAKQSSQGGGGGYGNRGGGYGNRGGGGGYQGYQGPRNTNMSISSSVWTSVKLK